MNRGTQQTGKSLFLKTALGWGTVTETLQSSHLKLPPPTPPNPVPLVSKKCGFTSMGLALETSSWAARGHTQLGVGPANSGTLETCRGTPGSHDWRL